MTKFPNQIYVTRENEGTTDEYLNTSETVENTAELGTKKRVAVYELKEVITVTTTVQANIQRTD